MADWPNGERELSRITIDERAVNNDNVVMCHTVDVSMVPPPKRNWVASQARRLEKEFLSVFDDQREVEDTFDSIPPLREKVGLEVTVPFDGTRAERETVERIADGFEQQLQRIVMEAREECDQCEQREGLTDDDQITTPLTDDERLLN